MAAVAAFAVRTAQPWRCRIPLVTLLALCVPCLTCSASAQVTLLYESEATFTAATRCDVLAGSHERAVLLHVSRVQG